MTPIQIELKESYLRGIADFKRAVLEEMPKIINRSCCGDFDACNHGDWNMCLIRCHTALDRVEEKLTKKL